MNWLSYTRIDMKTVPAYSAMIFVGSQRQGIRDAIRCIEPAIQRTLILDSIDYHGSYPDLCDPNDMYAHFHNGFLDRLETLPPDALIIIDTHLMPKDSAHQRLLEELVEQRRDRKWTIALIYSQVYSIPTSIAQAADYAFLHRVTSNDHAFRLFGRFFPDLQEFTYGVEQYAKYYEALVIDNLHQKALWYRPSHF